MKNRVDVYKIRDLLEIYNPLNVGQSQLLFILLSAGEGLLQYSWMRRQEGGRGRDPTDEVLVHALQS